MIRKRRLKSIQSTLFITYFYILTFVLIIFMSFFIIDEAKRIRNNAFLQMTQYVNTISSYVDEEAKTLHTVALNISYSNLIKERFTNYLRSADSSDIIDQDKAYDNIKNTKVLIDMLTAILGPNQPVVQIYLYSLDKGAFGVGIDNTTSRISVKDCSWYTSFMNSEHYKYLSCDIDERLKHYYSYKNGATFISLYEMYYDSFNIPQGIIEVKNPISFLSKKINNLVKAYDETFLIFDREGEAIYPNYSDTEYSHYFNSINSNLNTTVINNVSYYKYDKNTYLFYSRSDNTGFTSAIAVSNKKLLKPLYEYIRGNVVILFVTAFAMLLLSFIAAHIITSPVMKIYRQVQSFSLDTHNSDNNLFPDINTHIIEFNTLYSALISMQQKALQSHKREITLQNQEMQSRMLALQSQMNPHFLYNSLATIQSMADEHMYSEIHLMCQNISNILRYISSDKDLIVPLSLELNNTIDYLKCMKIRYDDDLLYEISIPDEMLHIKIPKLCLQLIVENSIKFTTKAIKPPWKIGIVGKLTNSYWELAISDNGTGFSQTDIDELNSKIEQINQTGLLPNLEISGMGLMNIYIRFKLLYKGSHIFRISNLAKGGALLTIGGLIDE